jgi:lysozyme
MMVRNKTIKKKGTGRRVKRKVSRKLQWSKLWPSLLGAAIVVVSCFLLFRAIFSSSAGADAPPPPGYTVHGIDVSHHQGVIDWELLRNQATINGYPLAFAFIKATEGSDITDSRFLQNFSAARQYGIMRGAYHFYRTSTSAKQQAAHFIRQVKLEQGDLPPVLDVEVKPADVSDEDFRQGILEWLVRVEQHYGVKPILYTYHSFRQQYMSDTVFNVYPYWIAHYYVDSVRYQGPWAFWQHSDIGQLPGIKEKVDLNVFKGTFDELRQMTLQ